MELDIACRMKPVIFPEKYVFLAVPSDLAAVCNFQDD